MGLHRTTKFLGFTVIGAVQLDIIAPFIVSSREMALIFTDIELCFAAMLFVQTVDLQLSNLPALLLQEHAREVSTATVRAGLVLLLPFIQTSLAILLLTAVDQVRLTQHFHANRASQLFRERLDKVIISIFTRSCHFELREELESHDLDPEPTVSCGDIITDSDGDDSGLWCVLMKTTTKHMKPLGLLLDHFVQGHCNLSCTMPARGRWTHGCTPVCPLHGQAAKLFACAGAKDG